MEQRLSDAENKSKKLQAELAEANKSQTELQSQLAEANSTVGCTSDSDYDSIPGSEESFDFTEQSYKTLTVQN